MFAVGHVLDATYRVERLLGKGGMAYVYVVSHVRLPRRFALKVITAPAAQGSEYVLRFRREAEILAELEHPNLVTVNDWNTTPDGKPYLVMELLTGEDLAQCLHRGGALPPRAALSIFTQVAEALQVAHARHIVHRDLKPANIFLCKNGPIPFFAKVLDFGIAKSSQHSGGAVTENLALMGTPAYMAPEQARGNPAAVDARTDQFALGLVLYEMLSGQPAFLRRGETPMLTLYRILSEEPEPLTDERLNRAIMRALRKDPADRYASLAEFVDAVMSCAPEPARADRSTIRALSALKSTAAVESVDEAAALASRPPTAPSLLKAVLSNITQPGAEILPVPKRTRRPGIGILISSGVLLACALVVLRLVPQQRSAPSPAKPPHPAVVQSEVLPRAGTPEVRKTADSPVVTSSAPPGHEAEDEPATAKPPVKSTATATAKGKPRRRALPAEVAPVLSGIDAKSAVGKFILSCVEATFGDSAHRASGLLIRLRRTERLKVASHLPAERSLQLEDCLSGLAASSVPKSVDIRFAAK